MIVRITCFLLLVYSVFACAGRGQGLVRHSGMEIVDMEPFGYTVSVTRSLPGEKNKLCYRGELVACDKDRVFILLHEKKDDAYMSYEWKDLTQAAFELKSRAPLGVHLGTLAGATLSVSHGWGMMVSIPFWFLIGLPLIFSSGVHPVDIPLDDPDPCDFCRKYARYPQGLPEEAAVKFGLGPTTVEVEKDEDAREEDAREEVEEVKEATEEPGGLDDEAQTEEKPPPIIKYFHEGNSETGPSAEEAREEEAGEEEIKKEEESLWVEPENPYDMPDE